MQKEPLKSFKWTRILTGSIIIFLVGVLILGGLLFRPVLHLLSTNRTDLNELAEIPPGYFNDASRLNQTSVSQVWRVPVDQVDSEDKIEELLEEAQAEGRVVSIAGARHSMGGHTIYPGGIVLDMLSFNRMELNQRRDILTVQAGARWVDIISFLDPKGLSVKVMQSNNSFSGLPQALRN